MIKMRYNVEIFDKKTGHAEVIIGKDMSYNDASKRKATGLTRINNRYDVRIIAVPFDDTFEYEIKDS